MNISGVFLKIILILHISMQSLKTTASLFIYLFNLLNTNKHTNERLMQSTYLLWEKRDDLSTDCIQTFRYLGLQEER